MPRKRPSSIVPNDDSRGKEFVINLALSGTWNDLKQLVNKDPEPSRVASLERRHPNELLKVTGISQTAAIAIHAYGKRAEKPCQRCQHGNGPFAQCVVLEGYDKLTLQICSNCRRTGCTRHVGKKYKCDAVEGNNEISLYVKTLRRCFFLARSRKVRLGRPQRSSNSNAVTLPTLTINENPAARSTEKYILEHSNEYTHLFGNLYLSSLSKETQEFQNIVLPLLLGLKELDRRDMRCKSHIFSWVKVF
jgi:hypothetical protein